MLYQPSGDLEAVVATNIKLRKKRWRQEKIIDAEERRLIEIQVSLLPASISCCAIKAEQMRLQEVKRALASTGYFTEKEKIMENMSKMIVRKLMRDPMISMNEVTGTSKENFYVDAICGLFKPVIQ